MSENLFPVYPIVGMERKAFIMPKDFFSMISVEQHVEEDKTNSFVFGFFDNANDAWQWLMQLPKKV
jgi:hypothetical protein